MVKVLERSISGLRAALVIDLSDLTFLDSSGIHALVKLSRALGDSGRLILESPHGEVQRAREIGAQALA